MCLVMCLLAMVVSAAEEKKEVKTQYFIFREDCFEAFFTRQDFFSDPTCLKFTFSKAVGVLVVGGSFIYKVPQIINIMKAGSSKGIQASAIYFESFTFLHTLVYSRHLLLDFSVYGETIFILVQQAIILMLVYHYDQTISIVEKIAFVAFFGSWGAWLIIDTNVPEWIWPILSSSNIGFVMLSRLPIIYNNFVNKSTGVLAVLTFTLGWGGAMARVATVLIESDDLLYRAQFVTSAFLNTLVMVQFALYWNSDKNKSKTSDVELTDAKKKPAETKKSR